MRKILFFLALLLMANLSFAVYVEIGTGTSSQNYIPVNGYYDYSWSQAIYLQSEISASINISKISYYVGNTPSNYVFENQYIYMKHTSDSSFPDATYDDPVSAGFTLVYHGSTIFHGTGWHDITLDTPFSYNGTDNLIIYWQNYDGTWASGYPSFLYTNATNTCKYKYQDGTFPYISGSRTDSRANIQLHYQLAGAPGEPSNPNPTDLATGVSAATDLAWMNGDNTETVQVLFGTEATPVTEVYNGAAVTSLLNAALGGPLAAGTTYYWQVICGNSTADLTTSGPIWSFTTYAPPLTGSKIIGTGGDFATFNDAVGYLALGGVGAGGVTFNVLAGTYTEQITIPAITGVSADNPVIFQAASTYDPPLLQYAATGTTDNWIVTLDGSSYITFQNMNFAATGTSFYGRIFALQNSAHHNNILNNNLTGIIYASSSNTHANIYAYYTSAINYNTISDNTITNGYCGIYLYGSSLNTHVGNVIQNNIISNFYHSGIYSHCHNDAYIYGNTVESGSRYGTCFGIYASYNHGALQVRNNVINLSASSTNYGLYASNSYGSAETSGIWANNMVSLSTGSSTAYGFYADNCYFQNVYHNSINVACGSATAGRALYFNSSTTGTYGQINVLNNIGVNTGGGYAVEISSGAATLGYVNQMDYNDYFASGAVLGRYNNSNSADLTGWQTASGFDANSLSIDPLYTGSDNLHANAIGLNESCPRLADVLTDIDGDSRPDPTDMGADEFTPAATALFTVVPDIKDFGTVNFGNSESQTFTVNNIGGAAGEILDVSIIGSNSSEFALDNLGTLPITVTAGGNTSFDVIYTPSIVGPVTATLAISDSRSRTITDVPLSGTGYDPTVSSFPWTENFDGTWSGTPAAPLGWTVINANNDSYYWSQSNTYISPTHSVPYAAHGMGNTDDWLITPPIDLTGINVRLKWWDKVESTSYPNSYKVFVSTTDSQISSFTNELGDYTCTNTAWTEHNLDLDSYNGEVIYIAFYQYASAATYWGFGIDDVLIEEIPVVPVFAIDPQEKDFGLLFVGETSAPQTFTIANSGGAAGQILDVSIIGSNSSEFALDNLGTLPITVTAGSFSEFDVIYSPTIAGPVTATLAIEYGNSTFDNVTLSGRAFPADYVFEGFDATAFPPGGWTNNGWSRTSTNYMGGGSAYKYGSTSTQYILSTPLLNIGAADVLNFWGRVGSLSGNLDIVYSADGASWTLLETVTYSATYTWENKTIDLSSLGRANYYIGFRTGLQSSSFYIDNVIHPPTVPLPPEPPTNPNPADDAVDIIETADLSWTNGFATETVDVYFGIDSTLVTNKDVSVKVVDDLDVASYDPGIMAYSTEFFWKVVCKNSVTRAEADGPVWSFITRDDPTLYPPFTEDFSTWYPINWTKAQGLLADPVVFNSTPTSNWVTDGFANVGSTGAAKCNIYSSTRKEWMITPPIDLNSRTNYLLTFDLALTAWNNTNPPQTTGIDDKFAVVISLDQGQTWSSANTLRLWDNAGSPYVYNDISYTGESVVIDISAYSGNTILIGFYGESTVSNADNDLFVDNVSVIITGALAGNVSEFVADAVIEGALIEIDDQTALTDANGDYLIETLYPGTYEVTCSADGYISQTILDLEITAGAPTMQNFILNWAECVVNPSTITENIESGAFQTVQVTITNTGNGPLEYSTDVELLTDAFDQRRSHNDLEFTENGWLSITSNASGTIAAGNSVIMDVLLDAAGLSGVTKAGNINITHNGQNVTEAVASVLVTMNVNLVTTPPNPATNPIPANNAVDVDLLPTLSWTNHGVVNQTVIEYRTSIFTPWRVWATLIGDDNQYTLEPDQILEYNKVYTWRVKNSNVIGNSVPTNWNFTTITAVAQNPTPDNGEVNVFVDTTLDWDDVPYADEYKVYLWYDDGLADTQVFVVNGEVALTSDFSMAEDLLFNTEYFWKIETYRTSRLQGTSAVWSFTTITAEPLAPFNPTPADDAVDISPLDITLEWECPNADSYDVYLDPAGTGQPTTLIASNIPTASFTLTAPLNWNTEYEWQVVATNAADRAVTYGPVWSFMTEIAIPAPFTEDFEGDVSRWVIGGVNSSWEIATPSGLGDNFDLIIQEKNGEGKDPLDTGNYDPQSAYSGVKCAGNDLTVDGLYNASENSYLISPPVDCTALNNVQLSFWRYLNVEQSWDEVYVEVTNDNVNWYSLGHPLYVQETEWTKITLDASAFAVGELVQFRWRLDSDSSVQYTGWNIDDVSIFAFACIPPSNLIASNITNSSADLGWTENNTPPATSWNIEWGPTGFVQGEGTTVTGVSTNPYSLTGLTSDTTYDWYVQAENNTDALSEWAGPNTFSTLFDGIQIGYGSFVDKHLPIEPYYGYTYSQTIYQAADFGDPGSGMQIEKIWYNYSYAGTVTNEEDDWVVYMGTTSSSSLTDWIPIAQLTEVFNGDVDLELVSGIGWLEIVLDTPFIYDPLTDGNLIIAVDENTPGYSSGSNDFFCDQDIRANVSVYFYSDGTNPDPASPPSVGSSYSSLSPYYPNTRFEFGTAPIPDPPANLTIFVDGSGNTVLNWDAVNGAGSYHVYASDTPDGVFADVSDAGAFAGTSWTSNAPMGEMKFFYVTADTAGIADQIPAGISTSRRNNQNEKKPADRLRR